MQEDKPSPRFLQKNIHKWCKQATEKKEKYESVLQELDVAFVFAIKISFYCIHCVMGMHRKTALLTVHLVLGRLYSFSLLSIFVYDTNLLILIYY